MFRWFEGRIDPFSQADRLKAAQPPRRLQSFYWYFAGQVWPLLAANAVVAMIAAIIEISLFTYMANIVDLVRTTANGADFFAENGPTLLTMATVAMVIRPLVFVLHGLISRQAVAANLTTLVEWQTHRYVLEQSVGFFQSDFAGRLANRVMQTAPALRESVLQTIDSLWFVAIYAIGSLMLFTGIDWRLAVPLLIWIASFLFALFFFIPRVKSCATNMAHARSELAGRIVDTYTNIDVVKAFSPDASSYNLAEKGGMIEYFKNRTQAHHRQMRMITLMESCIVTLNGVLMVATGALAIWLWSIGEVTVGTIVLTLGLCMRISSMTGWIMAVATGIFEDVGVVQEGTRIVAKQRRVVDVPNAAPLNVTQGRITFQNIQFQYERDQQLIDGLSLEIEPGERIGLVGRSGSGKSTLIKLLMRFHDLEAGQILIDGQDISQVDQNSLRSHIGVVPQDVSLLHRSVLDNILIGRAGATPEEAFSAARAAQAEDFILSLRDEQGRTDYGAHVGERGVKLSGGQRQRITIARVLLKNAPILILDEATSALDSDMEAAIQSQLAMLMQGKTAIAIAHRLSTVAAMDRLVVMDSGRIAEVGSHDELIASGGLYEQLWKRQSGGFLAE